MDGIFACPDCGSEIKIEGLSPGREAQCPWCAARVEVPFIPRADQIKRRGTKSRRRRFFWPTWVWAIITGLCLMIGLATTNRMVRSRWKAQESDSLARLIGSSESAEKAGRLSEALVELEGALAMVRKREASPVDLAGLVQRRDALAQREAKERLRALKKSGLDTNRDLEPLVGKALNLLARTHVDAALNDLEHEVTAELDRLRTAWAEADAKHAQTALKAGDFAEAASLCERLHKTSEQIPAAARLPLQLTASNLLQSIIQKRGVLIELVSPQYTLGTARDYTNLLIAPLSRNLLEAGYYPKPSKTVFEHLWARNIPFRFVMEIKERQDSRYFQSPNRLSFLDARLEFRRRDEMLKLLTSNAQSTVPLPGLPAFAANRVAISDHRSPHVERLLYDDARAAFVDRLLLMFKSLPRFDTL